MKSPSQMSIIQIELTNACPKRCSNCTRLLSHVKKPFFMELDFFKKAIDSLDGFEGMVGLMGGEPTLHPDFEKMVEYAAEKRQKQFQPSLQFREPIEDFGRDSSQTLQKIHYPLGLFSMCGPTYYKHYELIQEHFHYQCLNDHLNEGLHQALLTTRKELCISDEEWYPLRDACWIQNTWSASITPKGAFFCEIAAALDMIYNGPGGWPVEPGWWKRLPDQFGKQLDWCEQCGAALKTSRRKGKEEIEDMSPHHYEKLKQVGSPAIRKGKLNILEVGKYQPENYIPNPDSYMPNNEKLTRYKQDNPSLKPKSIDAIILCNGVSEDLLQILEHALSQVDTVTVVADEADSAAMAIVQKQQKRMADPSILQIVASSPDDMLQTGFHAANPKDWVLLLNPTLRLPRNYSKLKNIIINPGCLYYVENSEMEVLEGSESSLAMPRFCLFNVLARSLRGCKEMKKEIFFNIWPEDKRIPLHGKMIINE